jgi:acyl carrier protein
MPDPEAQPDVILLERVKRLIIDRLKLELEPAAIEDDAPLFGTGLGLDSIDALELVVGLEQEFKIRISDQEVARRVFASARAISHFVAETGSFDSARPLARSAQDERRDP